jgi:hypothetical protein
MSIDILELGDYFAARTSFRAIVDGVFWYTKHVHYTLVWI